jgi:hypothetical protein
MTHRLFRLLLALSLPGATLALTACTADDDDSADDDDTPEGEAPSINLVNPCEVPVNGDCVDEDDPSVFPVNFDITVADVDGDLNNPPFFMIVDGTPSNGRLEGDLGTGGVLSVRLCNRWVRGAEVEYEVWMEDAAGWESNHYSDTWLVPAEDGDDDCTLQ